MCCEQGHILIDSSGNPRLAIAGRSSIVTALGTSNAGRGQPTPGGDADDSRYSAPEIQRPEDYGLDNILLTKESDMYEMAMVIYEARYYRPDCLGRGSGLMLAS